uniref:TGS domain-containing protein n=1 Tax=Echinostoma caproni TaxID=27848 RepID=A0A183ATN2_9TREM
LQEVNRLAREPHSVVVSCNMKLNLDYLLEKLWEHLDLIQVFTKKRGQRPDLEEGLILRNGSTIEHVCHMIHRTLVSEFKCALVWLEFCKPSLLVASEPEHSRPQCYLDIQTMTTEMDPNRMLTLICITQGTSYP